MRKKLKGIWRRIKRIFCKRKRSNLLAEYDGKRCKVYCIDGVKLVGTVQILEDPGWIRIIGKPKSCLLKISQIASVTAE